MLVVLSTAAGAVLPPAGAGRDWLDLRMIVFVSASKGMSGPKR